MCTLISVVKCICACTGFPSFKLDFSNGDQVCCIQGTILGPGFGCADIVLTPCLTDAVMKGVKVRGRLL